MQQEIARRSRWVMRVMEWNDDKARYPNVWLEGMPRQLLAQERVACRLRLGDLIAVFNPSSRRHPERSERYLGLSRVAGLRRAVIDGSFWIDLETAWRLDPPLSAEAPRRVFLCCDPGWPGEEVALFARVFDAACSQGFRPAPGDGEPAQPDPAKRSPTKPAKQAVQQAKLPPAPRPRSLPGERQFAGVALGADMRDPRDGTWLATVALRDERLAVVHVEPIGRSGLQAHLRAPDRGLAGVEAIGLDFPFGLPLQFAETLLKGGYPQEGWWEFARRLERVSRPDYLVAIQDFREAHGEARRLTDERLDAPSPLRRTDQDLGSMAYYGIRMIVEDRSRFAVRPFESAQGKLLLEVHPRLATRGLEDSGAILDALATRARLPLEIDDEVRRRCAGNRAALDAVVAARCAALALLGGETDLTPEQLAPDAAEDSERIRREGWIYGMKEPEA